MLPIKTQELILSLKEQNVAIRDMVRLLKVSRNTIRRVLRQNKVLPCQKGIKTPDIEPLLPELFERCQGNTVRVQEILAFEHNLDVAYSTITRRVREQQLRAQKRLVGEYHFEPGLEMQHDTSPHKITIDNKKITLQCASLVLAYSRKIFIKYYARFTRFEAKLFLTEAIGFMGGACKRCIVDNTSVILASGSGSNAVIAPEMASLLQFFGSKFIAHAVGHADRKAVVGRAFFYVERNFGSPGIAGKLANFYAYIA
jgi:transposase